MAPTDLWQEVISVIRALTSDNSSTSYEIPFERGTIFFSCELETQSKTKRVKVHVKDVFSNTHDLVCEVVNPEDDNFHILRLEQGQWVETLKNIANTFKSDKENYLDPIDDSYVFPEYAKWEANLDIFPILGGRYNKWRQDGSGLINHAIRHLLKGKQYTSPQLNISATYTKKGGIRHTEVSIPPPIVMPKWRIVYSADLRGDSLFSSVFRPGKWIFYLQDKLSQKPEVQNKVSKEPDFFEVIKQFPELIFQHEKGKDKLALESVAIARSVIRQDATSERVILELKNGEIFTYQKTVNGIEVMTNGILALPQFRQMYINVLRVLAGEKLYTAVQPNATLLLKEWAQLAKVYKL